MAAGETDPEVFGATVDEQTRCVHWRSELDIIAIQFACCRHFYPCVECHDADVDHECEAWPRSARHEPAVLCGVCRRRLSIDSYLAAGDTCPQCGAGFNPGCRLHHDRYFTLG